MFKEKKASPRLTLPNLEIAEAKKKGIDATIVSR